MVALVVLGGKEDFTPLIVGWIFAVNSSARRRSGIDDGCSTARPLAL
jgi:hypothetical protein